MLKVIDWSDTIVAIRERLKSTRMKRATYATATAAADPAGPHRVYSLMDDYGKPEGLETEPWGRVVVVPADVISSPPMDAEYMPLVFLVRAEFNNFRLNGFNPHKSLGTMMDEAYVLLQHWRPPAVETKRAHVAQPIYLTRPPQGMPLWDDERRLHMLSAEYRTSAVPALPAVASIDATAEITLTP